jgi:hypothetical protein
MQVTEYVTLNHTKVGLLDLHWTSGVSVNPHRSAGIRDGARNSAGRG